MIKKFPKQFMLDMLWDESDDAEVIEDKITDNGRWSIHHKLIFKHKDKFYSTGYSVGATEMQDEGPWEDEDEVECTEVEPKEKTITVYVSVTEG